MATRGLSIPKPTSKTVIRPSGKYKYVYYVLKSYRNDKGQPTNDTILIGKIDPNNPNNIIPNDNYFDIFKDVKIENEMRTIKEIRDYGNYFVCNEIANKLGITNILKKVFPNKYNELLLIAYYMLNEGNVMSYIDDFCENTYTNIFINNKQTSNIFYELSYKERMEFFKLWSKKVIENEYIAYDVTSISSYSKSMDSVEWGYNRDNEDLPQINIGMFYGEESKLPVYYNSYYGSITDKEHLICMMENTKELGIKNVKFVMDKGFYKKDNLNYMVKNNYPFIISLSNSNIFTKKVIDDVRSKIISSKNRLKKYPYFGMISSKNQEEIKYNVHVVFNEEKVSDENNILYERIDRYETELQKMERLPEKTITYEKYFKITRNKDNTFTYERDYEKIDKEMSYSGYIVFLTTDLYITTDKVIEIYRNKDIIEKAFDNLKNEMDLRRMRTHANETWDGKMFVSFIGLILRSYIEKNKKGNKDTKDLTIKKILLELKKIKTVTYMDDTKFMNPLTAKQKTILKTLDIDIDKLKRSLE